MSQISRLKSAEISNGNLINADDLDAEFNQLVNESNSQDTRIGTIENSNVTLAGVKTFSSAPKTNQIDERTTDSGVTIDGVLLKDGAIKTGNTSDPGTPSNGMLWYNSTENTLKAHVNGETKPVFGGFPPKYLNGPLPKYTSAASVTLPSGLSCRSADNTLDITFGSDAVVSLASSGANGLDTGSEASDTWYYLWAIADSTGSNSPAGLLSTSASSPTLPTGYDKKRLMPLAIRNDGSGNLIPFYVSSGWPQRPRVMYKDINTRLNNPSVTGTTNILSSGTATSATAVSCASFVPPVSKIAILMSNVGGTSPWGQLRTTGDTNWLGIEGSSSPTSTPIEIPTDSSQSIDYRMSYSNGNITLDVLGFVITEVN